MLNIELVVDKVTDTIAQRFSGNINKKMLDIKQALYLENSRYLNIKVIDGTMRSIIRKDIWFLAHKTFVYEFHDFRRRHGYPLDSNSSTAFEEYINNFNSKTVEQWFLKYQFLHKIIENSINNTGIFLEEVVNNFHTDISKLILADLIRKDDEVMQISSLNSDPHNGNKRILCFLFNSKNRLIYKPRSLAIDKKVKDIFDTAFPDADFSPVPNILSDTDFYGWQQYIEQKPTANQDISSAYIRLGLCSAIFRSMGATDIHEENIIFSNGYPFLIDLETFFRGQQNIKIKSFLEKMAERINNSIVGTSILPCKVPVPPFNIMCGAINTPYPQKTQEKVFSMINFGTDAVDISKQLIDVGKETKPILLENNGFHNPVLFQKDFVYGYQKGFKKVLENKLLILKVLESSQFPVRLVIRPTAKYFRFLEALLFPENLIDEKTVSNVLQYLKEPLSIKNNNISQHIIEVEKKSLKNGDIPYFYSFSCAKSVQSGDSIFNNIFDYSPTEQAVSILNSLSENDLLLDNMFIAEAYSEIKIKNSDFEEASILSSSSPFFKKYVDLLNINNVDPIINLIEKLSIYKDAKKTAIGWIGGSYIDLPISYHSEGFISLHDTGGILFLLEHQQDVKNNNLSKSYYQKALQGSKQLKNEINSLNHSIISGEESLEFLYKHNESYSLFLEDYLKNNTIYSEADDLFMGLPGILLCASSFSDISDNIIKESYDKFPTWLNNKTTYSLAHGKIGILWAQFRVSKSLNMLVESNKIFGDLLNISREVDFTSGGWCNGYAGLLMVLAEAATALGKEINDHLYNLAIKASNLDDKTSMVDISICHGAGGILQSILYTFCVTKDRRFLTLANTYWSKVLNIMKTSGFTTGSQHRDHLLGYFLGWSGFADSALLLEMINDNKQPYFPLNLSTKPYQIRRK